MSIRESFIEQISKSKPINEEYFRPDKETFFAMHSDEQSHPSKEEIWEKHLESKKKFKVGDTLLYACEQRYDGSEIIILLTLDDLDSVYADYEVVGKRQSIPTIRKTSTR